MKLTHTIALGALAALPLAVSGVAGAQQPSAQERAAALKTTLAASKTMIKQYEWIETTVVSLKGEEKSRKQERCYYGADGGIEKVPVGEEPAPEKKRGLRGRIAESKKEELTSYMKDAVALLKTYVPPDPAKIQAAKNAGKVAIEVLEPGKRARLDFHDYEKPGDNLGVDIDLANNRPLGLTVATYLADASDAVTLDVHMGQLDDGTVYASETTLVAKAKELQVSVQNAGYKKSTN